MYKIEINTFKSLVLVSIDFIDIMIKNKIVYKISKVVIVKNVKWIVIILL